MKTNHQVRLDPRTHTYWLGDRRLESVGALVKRVTPEFDAQFWAKREAAKSGRSVDDVLAGWKAKRDTACDDGHLLHGFIKQTLEDKAQEGGTDIEPIKCRHWLEWWAKAKVALTPVKVEGIVWSERLGCAGTLDLLAKSIKTNNLVVLDWKQNRHFRVANDFGKALLPPFEDLPECEFTRYSLQVSLYRLMVEEALGQAIGDSWIVHVTEENATPYRALDLRQRAADWVEGLEL